MGCAEPAEHSTKEKSQDFLGYSQLHYPKERGTVGLTYLGVSGKTGVYGGGPDV